MVQHVSLSLCVVVKRLTMYRSLQSINIVTCPHICDTHASVQIPERKAFSPKPASHRPKIRAADYMPKYLLNFFNLFTLNIRCFGGKKLYD